MNFVFRHQVTFTPYMQNFSSSLSSILHEIQINLKELESVGAFYVLMITTSFHAVSSGVGRDSENIGIQHWKVVIFFFQSDSSSDIRERQSQPEVNVILSSHKLISSHRWLPSCRYVCRGISGWQTLTQLATQNRSRRVRFNVTKRKASILSNKSLITFKSTL